MRETAYAKINLALHVRARREDGYHELETLFAFVDAGDVLSVEPAEADRLWVVGEFSGLLTPRPPSPWGGAGGGGSAPSAAAPPHPDPPPRGGGSVFDNLVARALSALPRPQGLAVTLEKNLPVAAGLGGGSADAGAVFRIVRERFGLPDDWRTRAAKLGADVPACVESRTCIGRGTGTELEELADDSLAGVHVLLVNPRVALTTGPVFAGWDGVDRGALPSGSVREIALAGRNDLAKPAIELCPVIAEVLAALDATEPLLARMSGSGATCFALYDTKEACDSAARTIARAHADWWQMTGTLR